MLCAERSRPVRRMINGNLGSDPKGTGKIAFAPANQVFWSGHPTRILDCRLRRMGF